MTPALGMAETLTVIEHATSNVTTHVGPKPDNAGDLLTFANPIYDAANTKKIGSDQGFCIRVTVGRSYECFWTLLLADGQITVEGPYLDAGDSVLAVTGGTGRFLGVRGEMKLHARDPQASSYDFVYDLRGGATR